MRIKKYDHANPTVMKVEYAWIAVDDVEVEVGDIEDDTDYAGVINQIHAMGLGYAD